MQTFQDTHGDQTGERLMEVSTDGGKTWSEAQLPTITEDRVCGIMKIITRTIIKGY